MAMSETAYIRKTKLSHRRNQMKVAEGLDRLYVIADLPEFQRAAEESPTIRQLARELDDVRAYDRLAIKCEDELEKLGVDI